MKKVIFLLLAFALTSSQADDLQTQFTRLGFHTFTKEIPIYDFELESLDGQTISLSSLRGKVIFLNFWATWCPPCRSEMPSMERIYKELKDEGFEIVAVDLQEDKKRVQKFEDDFGLSFTVLLDKTGRIGQSYGARSIPTTYIIDKNGIILARALGAMEWFTPEILSLFRAILKR